MYKCTWALWKQAARDDRENSFDRRMDVLEKRVVLPVSGEKKGGICSTRLPERRDCHYSITWT
jgi:hypothetical protein